MTDDEWEELDMKTVSTIRLLLADEVMYNVMEENSTTGIWLNLEKRYVQIPHEQAASKAKVVWA